MSNHYLTEDIAKMLAHARNCLPPTNKGSNTMPALRLLAILAREGPGLRYDEGAKYPEPEGVFRMATWKNLKDTAKIIDVFVVIHRSGRRDPPPRQHQNRNGVRSAATGENASREVTEFVKSKVDIYPGQFIPATKNDHGSSNWVRVGLVDQQAAVGARVDSLMRGRAKNIKQYADVVKQIEKKAEKIVSRAKRYPNEERSFHKALAIFNTGMAEPRRN